MRKTLLSLVLLLGITSAGCTSIPQEALDQARDNALISDAFVGLMLDSKTSREQEQAFILANRKAWHTQNFALNDVALPPDLASGERQANLLEILKQDPAIRAKMHELEETLTPAPAPAPAPEGN